MTEPTPRQMEVLRLAFAGMTNPQIAARLRLSTQTVKNHLTSAFGRLGAENRTQAYMRLGWIDPQPAGDVVESLPYPVKGCRCAACERLQYIWYDRRAGMPA